MDFLYGFLAVFGAGLFACILIVSCHFLFKVEENKDEEANEIFDLLPHLNCGACGYSGCRAFAAALISGESVFSKCPHLTQKNKRILSEKLGQREVVYHTMQPEIHCVGGYDADTSSIYKGVQTCKAMHEVCGGNLVCKDGCMGLMDCAKKCRYNAISLVNGRAYINPDKCVSCQACVTSCPHNLIKNSIAKKATVVCQSCSKTRSCKHECIRCGLCAKICPVKCIEFDGKNVPLINEHKCIGCGKCVNVCPAKCIAMTK